MQPKYVVVKIANVCVWLMPSAHPACSTDNNKFAIPRVAGVIS